MRKILLFASVVCLLLAAPLTLAQDLTTKGGIAGHVFDAAGAAVPNAKVTVNGPTGERTTVSNGDGFFEVPNLIPGRYSVRVEVSGFKTATTQDFEILVGKTATLDFRLEAGQVTETVNVTAASATDLSSTAVSSNLNDQLYQNIPVQRSVTSLFYLAPGATDSLGGGTANPSIAGGSALDNLYIADGVNITDSAFGGLGTFSRSYGSLGTGINTEFIKEVQVKTGGFEPQYGQSEGGIINIITKSGTNEYHGSIFGYAKPSAFEADRRQVDVLNVNKVGQINAVENYDVGADVGGPVPGLKNKLFFYGSFNPSIRRELVQGAQGSGLLTLLGETDRRYRTLNYAAKVDYNLTANHQFNFSIFGDPSRTNLAPFSSLNIDNTTAASVLDYGTRNIAARYNGTFGSANPLTVIASFGQNRNHFNETGFANLYQIVDRTNPVRGNFIAVGRGFIEPTDGTTYRTTIDVSKQFNFFGTHTVGVGYNFQKGFYSGFRGRSGPNATVPATNAAGTPLTQLAGGAAQAIGQPLNGSFSLRRASASCTLCPLLTVNGKDVPVYLRQDRGEFGNPVFDTYNNYNAAYVQDTYRINRFVTVLLGLRMEQERIVGNPGSDGRRIGYSFTGQYAPRIGVTVDPLGKGQTKVFYNFGRFFEYLPLDLAERSLSSEKDFTGARFAPDFTVVNGVRRVVLNSFGTVTPVIDAAHLLTGVTGGAGGAITISAQDPSNPILPGTKLGYSDEHIIGFEQQLKKGFVLQVRYQDRRLKRVVEDAAVVSPEAANFFGQTYFIGNINSKTDAAVNPISHVFTPTFNAAGAITNAPSVCNPNYVTAVTDNFGNLLGAVCYETNGKNGRPAGDSGADGVPDGFPDPVRNYKALEIELNKRFSEGYQILSNFRIASLRGNYEGHFRNDNGQTDPGISSLFDFTAGDFNLLGNQFAVGPLNTDRRFVANVYGSYSFDKGRLGQFGETLRGLTLGLNIHGESGVPYSKFGAHPVYLNAGEVPLGGRGALGRSPFYTQLDLHADFPYHISENKKISFVADFFNITNNRRERLINQFYESTAGQLNPDFGKPASFHLPFNFRLGARFDF